MKKKASSPQKSRHKWTRKIFAAIMLGFCFSTLLLMEAQYSRIKALASLYPPFVQKPKIAFLFIARNRLPLEMVWDASFQIRKISIQYSFTPGNKATTRSAFFLNRQLNDSIQVDWGEASMIQAERILLQHALMDPHNKRFVFLSDSFADTKEGRYNPKMHPVIPVQNWRKGSQWVVLTRKHAKIVMKDDVVFPMFQLHCKTKSLPEFWRERPQPADNSKEHNCIPDEHYVQTLLADIDNIHYETEYRRERCTSMGKPSSCFLFARIFTRPAALRLLNMSSLGAFREARSN